MKEKEKPIQKYLSVCEECQDTEKRKNEMDKALLKDELITIAEQNNVDVNKSSTKEEIAEKLVKPEVYKDIVEEKDELGTGKESGREKPERPEPELPDAEIFSPFQEIFSESVITGPQNIDKLWREGMEEVEDNLEEVTNSQIEYWENLEDEWTKRASEFQGGIEELRENSELPAEEVKDLAVIWRNFYNKMSARITKVSAQTRKRQKALSEIMEKYRERSSEAFTEESDLKDVGKIFGLWSDFSEDMRKEMEAAIEDFDIDYGDYTETWKKFSEKTENVLDELQKNQTTQIENLYEQWNSNFKQFRDQIERGYSEYENIYSNFWNEIENQSRNMTRIASEIAEEMEENYSNILESYIETVNRGYTTLFNMPGLPDHISEQEKTVEDLKKRVEELEEQIEGD